jgi:hypothetical protein
VDKGSCIKVVTNFNKKKPFLKMSHLQSIQDSHGRNSFLLLADSNNVMICNFNEKKLLKTLYGPTQNKIDF